MAPDPPPPPASLPTPPMTTPRDSDKGCLPSVITSGFVSLVLCIILIYHYLILKSGSFLFIHFPALFSSRSCSSSPSPAVSLCDVTRPSSACFAPISAPSPAIDGLMMPPALSHEINLLCFCFNWFLILFTVGRNDVNSWAFFLLNFGHPGWGLRHDLLGIR